jgi:hypothetical protein
MILEHFTSRFGLSPSRKKIVTSETTGKVHLIITWFLKVYWALPSSGSESVPLRFRSPGYGRPIAHLCAALDLRCSHHYVPGGSGTETEPARGTSDHGKTDVVLHHGSIQSDFPAGDDPARRNAGVASVESLPEPWGRFHSSMRLAGDNGNTLDLRTGRNRRSVSVGSSSLKRAR